MAKVRSLSSYYMLEGKTNYPPTFFLHGTGDVTVPVEQSYRMAKRLRGMGVPVGEAYCEGGPHSFEQQIEVGLFFSYEGLVMLMEPQGPQDAGWEEYIIPCMDFVDKHVKA